MAKISLDSLLANLKILSDESRLRILNLLRHEELNVTDITNILGLSQPRISRHLKILGEADIVLKKREGANIYFSLSKIKLTQKLLKLIFKNLNTNDPTLIKDIEILNQLKNDKQSSAQSFFDNNAKDWDKIRSFYIDDELIEKSMLDIIKDKNNIDCLVDLGTGTGRILELLAPFAKKAYGIDKNRKMLLVASDKLQNQKHINCELITSDLLNIDLESNISDLTIFHQVLHYLDNPIPALSEMARITKKGGDVLIVDFQKHNFEILRKNYAHRILGFESLTISNYLENLNFKMLEQRNLYNSKTNNASNLIVSIWYARKY